MSSDEMFTISISGDYNVSNLVLGSTNSSIVENGVIGNISSDPKVMKPIFTIHKRGATTKYAGHIVKSAAGKTVALLTLYPSVNYKDGGLIAIDCDIGKIMWFRSVAKETADTSTNLYLFDPSGFGKYVKDASGVPNMSSGYEWRTGDLGIMKHPTFGLVTNGINQIRNTPFIELSYNLVWVNSAILPYIGAYDIDTGERHYQFDGLHDYAYPFDNFNKWDTRALYDNTVKTIRNNLYVEREEVNGVMVPMVYFGTTIVGEYQFINFLGKDDTEKIGAFSMTGQLRKMNAVDPSVPVWDFFNNPEEILNVPGEVIPDSCFRPSNDTLTCYTAITEGLPFTDFSDNTYENLETVIDTSTVIHVHVEDISKSSKPATIIYSELATYQTKNIVPPGAVNITFVTHNDSKGAPLMQQQIRAYKDASGTSYYEVSGNNYIDLCGNIVPDASLVYFGVELASLMGPLSIVWDSFTIGPLENSDISSSVISDLNLDVNKEWGFLETTHYVILMGAMVIPATANTPGAMPLTVFTLFDMTFDVMFDTRKTLAQALTPYYAAIQSTSADISGWYWNKLAREKVYDASVPYTFNFTSNIGTTLSLSSTYTGYDPSGVAKVFTGEELIGPVIPQKQVPTLMKVKVKKGFVFADTEWSKYIAYTQNYYGCSTWQQDYVITPGANGTITFPVGNATRQAADETFFLKDQEDIIEGLLDYQANKITLQEYENIVLSQTNQTPFLSPRGKRACLNSTTTIRKSDAALVQILKTVNYDSWDTGAMGGIGAFFGLPPYIGQTNNRAQLLHWGPDGDTVNAVLLDNGMIGMASKSGMAVFGHLHSPQDELLKPLVVGDVQMNSGISGELPDPSGTVRYFIGYSGTIGGTNYGCGTDGKTLFCTQSNSPFLGMLQFNDLFWFTKDRQALPIGLQYTVAVNPEGILWESTNGRGQTGTQGLNAPGQTIYRNGAVWVGNGHGGLGLDPATGAVKYHVESEAVGYSGVEAPTVGEKYMVVSGGETETGKIQIFKF